MWGSIGKGAELSHRIRLFDINRCLAIEANLALFSFISAFLLALTMLSLRLESYFIYGFSFTGWHTTLASSLLIYLCHSLLLQL